MVKFNTSGDGVATVWRRFLNPESLVRVRIYIDISTVSTVSTIFPIEN